MVAGKKREKRELLLRVTAKDCRWDYFKGSGAGGQKRHKTASAVRCTHPPSGAVGTAQDTRSQRKNKQLAFRRMAETKKFDLWSRIECARRLGTAVDVEKYVEDEMANPDHFKVEIKNNGRWVEE